MYKQVGGAPHLDNQYTVFAEIIEGMNVVDSIQAVATDRNDRPYEDIRILKAVVRKECNKMTLKKQKK
jgi:peptidyl-prolyl cis-trans isomerase B (cyclophilin B)